jgi:F-type H+-transporting ATPase subunit delta
MAMRAPVCGPAVHYCTAFVPQPTRCKEPERVENSGGITASLQGRYASALYDLASEQKAVPAVESDLEKLGEAISQSAEFAGLIRNPQVSRSARFSGYRP